MNTRTSVTTERLSETDFLSFLIDHALDNNLSVALWRLPNQTTKQAILCHQHHPAGKDKLIEDLPPGFIFAPFDKEKEGVYLPADFFFTVENNELKTPESSVEVLSHTWLNENFTRSDVKTMRLNPARSKTSETKKSDFTESVRIGIDNINSGSFEKIVISKTRIVNLTSDFDVINAFQKLCNAHPHALVSFVSIPGVGSWLGATPELLVSLEDKTIFKTVALAGTKAVQEPLNLKSVSWTQKEIEEQALVERYIISCFKKIRLRDYDEHGPKTVVAGNLMHLKSEFTVNMTDTNFPLLGSTMLQLLHPTSAVCGMPLQPALDFIKKYEHYDREFYSGYLGPANIANNTCIFVNIRCVQLFADLGICYAGAGITADSDPEEEWLETELKLNTLLNIIV